MLTAVAGSLSQWAETIHEQIIHTSFVNQKIHNPDFANDLHFSMFAASEDLEYRAWVFLSFSDLDSPRLIHFKSGQNNLF